jgi:DNA repair protein RecN (Recombination protein N)
VLLEMRLRGLGVIEDAVLEFGPGLTVVTGETGAGKTMVVTGLGLLMGGRGDPGAVRTGAQLALVEGRVEVDPSGPVAVRAQEAGAVLEDGELVIARTVSNAGRSRAHLGGRSVPVATLIELSGELVAVHGQSDQIRLQAPGRQRESLDRFAGTTVTTALTAYRRTWKELRETQARLAVITQQARERTQEAELLRLGLAEVEKVAPQPGEDHALKAEALRLSHAEGLQQAAHQAGSLLAGDASVTISGPDVAALVSSARHALDAAADHDPKLAELAVRAAEIGYLAEDLATECASYAANVDSDPARLAAVEDRRAVLGQLSRTHHLDIDGVLAWAQTASTRLQELDGDEDALIQLGARVEELGAELGEQAATLTARRTKAAATLGAAVTAELQELSMPGAKVEVRVSQAEPGPDGADEIEMLFAGHPGAPPRPLGRGASGGELSRVMLGLEVVLGAADPVPTFVFDEVDAGVGGAAALGIGRRLARLARSSQVLVVTHLPQVAAFADRHLLVRKAGDGQITSSGVHTLDDAGRVRELARMLGGVEDSGSAQAHADELLQLARDHAAEHASA